MKKKMLLPILLFTILIVSSCADVEVVNNCVNNNPYGFWGGLWHGIVAPFAFITSLFIDSVAMYALNNTGGWYDFGFVLGAGILSFSSGRSTK